jgi:hypothetical protein
MSSFFACSSSSHAAIPLVPIHPGQGIASGLLPVVTVGQEPHKQLAPSLLAHCTWAPPSMNPIGAVIPGTHCIFELPGGEEVELTGVRV